ncbi:glycosidase [Mesotoga sp. Brook.08.YT.4.2.5.1]|uniref:glycoside hydrolase family 130 protein n=1 Tax=unclassified Mesotoga TaxID=1184398 RepID=UPI000AE2A9E0|nr:MULTISPECIES: glycoside hydrolase family 130 protein [unclassified Mesotoga]MDD3459921.1 glycoside hydrolase family 130 protein [Mesotoga sp.]PNQ05201.1 glycosidase [Mesotoga sp. SC_NapDC3]PXF34205.1 glycosidase [Mesotoga sp. SC_NapDC]RIZ61065.1 glycosidase [Mesotoga sp. SC_NapDC2]PNE22400.1 glycosidase [Mesotoga sp. Brook.08.YT.4.2.5.1]
MRRLLLVVLLSLCSSVFSISIEFESLYNIERASELPIVMPQGVGWESKAVFNPAAIVIDSTVYLLYRSEDWAGTGRWNGTSRIGLATSADGFEFSRRSDPLISPTESYEIPGGCEDPRIVKIDDTYILTYTGYDGGKARLCIAVSKDFEEWEKLGPVFKDDTWSKSGAIVPAKIDGKYFMYFGDSSIKLAYSTDLRNWTVFPRPVLEPRQGYFDSRLIEPGPTPIITEEGILLIYNSADFSTIYRPGAALFDISNPRKLIMRTDRFLAEPELIWEKQGQVPNVIFIEGAVVHEEKLILYYGAADTYIGAFVVDLSS